MKPGNLIFVTAFFLLAGCGPNVQIVNHPKPDLKVDFSPFEEMGCPRNQSGYLNCQEDSSLYGLGCDFIRPASEFLGGLTPAYPLAVCIYRPYIHPELTDRYSLPDGEYFFNEGGTMPDLVRYVILVDGSFKLIKNPDEFRAVFSPVDSQEEALSFSLVMKNLYATYGREVDQKLDYYVKVLEDTHVEKVNDDYVVHVFAYQLFGCGPHNTYAIDMKVTVDGFVEEIQREKIFNDPANDDLCVD